MAKKFPENNGFNVEEIIDVLSESPKTNWGKVVARISWNGKPSTIDIRTMNLAEPDKMWPKGVSLTEEEADKLTDVFLDNDYGSIENLKAALKRKEHRYSELSDELDEFNREFSSGSTFLVDKITIG